MSPSFNAVERRAVEQKLRDAAMRAFAARGVRRTSLEELTAEAGVSKSSFYSFFPSKEALFLELMLADAGSIGDRLAAAARSADDTRAGVAGILREIVSTLDNHPLFRRILSHPEEVQALRLRLGDDDVRRVQTQLIAPVLDFFAQADGSIKRIDPAVLLGVFQAVSLVHVNAAEFDSELYPKVLETLIEAVSTGLTASA